MKTLLVNTQSSAPRFLILIGGGSKNGTHTPSEPRNTTGPSVSSALLHFKHTALDDVMWTTRWVCRQRDEMKVYSLGLGELRGLWELVQRRHGLCFQAGDS